MFLFILQSLVNRQKFKNKPPYVCFVDLTKAFDYVHRHALYYKLMKRGLKGKMLNLVCDMYKKKNAWSNGKENWGRKLIANMGCYRVG